MYSYNQIWIIVWSTLPYARINECVRMDKAVIPGNVAFAVVLMPKRGTVVHQCKQLFCDEVALLAHCN